MSSYLSRGRSTCKVMATFYWSDFNKSDEQMTVIQATLWPGKHTRGAMKEIDLI